MDFPIRPLMKSRHLIVQLTIIGADDKPAESPYGLQEGANLFRCLATYVDGSTFPFAPYWTCPLMLRSGGSDDWAVLGRQRRESVVIHASKKQERYQELACWVVEPPADGKNIFPFAAVSFDYSEIEAES